jgi:RNA polymerase sigma factor (sigma-70 family)
MIHAAPEPPQSGAPRPPEAAALTTAGLYRAHAAFLSSVLSRLCGPGPHVDDLVQETFLVAHRRSDAVSAHPQPRAWLYRVAANLVLHHRRGFARRERLASRASASLDEYGAAPTSEELVARKSEAQALEACVHQLPLPLREAFVLFELEGMSSEAIATLTGTPAGTIRRRVFTARAELKTLWAARRASPPATTTATPSATTAMTTTRGHL